MPCRFCTIDEERQQVLEKRNHVYIMPSNPRLIPGHLLVIPIRHIEDPTDLRTDEQYELFDTVIELQTKILMLKAGMGCEVRQNCRPFLLESGRYPINWNKGRNQFMLGSYEKELSHRS